MRISLAVQLSRSITHTAAKQPLGLRALSTVGSFRGASVLHTLHHNALPWRPMAPKALASRMVNLRRQWVQSSTQPSVPTTTAGTITSDQEEKQKRILYGSWIDRLPAKLAPYAFLARIDKPIGTWLLFWPCAWSVSMASYSAHISPIDAGLMISLFGIGCLVMRGAGCTINDLWDRDFDRQVERTKMRPLAAGTVTVPQALAFTGLQLATGLSIFAALNEYTMMITASSLALVVAYPLMKRVTYWPQFVLGLAYNWGALVGWSSMMGACDLSICGPLYLGGIAWTLTYDTIYAHQDKKDDVKAGVKSTALYMGDKTNTWLTGFSSFFVGATALAGYMNGHGLPFYTISVAGAAAHLAWQLKTVNYDDPKSCWEKFRSNHQLGAIVWSGIVADSAYAALLAA